MLSEFKKQKTSREKPIVIKSFGKCIYCGRSDIPLFREHVIPRGIGSGLIILGASCRTCADITKVVEQVCLRDNFGIYRLTSKFKTYHKKEIKKTLPLRFIEGDSLVEREHPVSEHPNIMYLPRLRKAPRILKSLPPKSLDNFYYLLAYIGTDIKVSNAITMINFDIYSFYRLIAKIAHGFCVAHSGLDGFKHFLPDLILGKNRDLCTYLIGKNVEQEFGTKLEPNYRTRVFPLTHDGKWLVCSTIQLFSNEDALFPTGQRKGTPIYYIVAGELLT